MQLYITGPTIQIYKIKHVFGMELAIKSLIKTTCPGGSI